MTLIPRPSRAPDVVTIAKVGSGRVPRSDASLRASDRLRALRLKKFNSLGTSSRPSWLGLSVSIALLSNTGISTLEIAKYSGADSLLRQILSLPQYDAKRVSPNGLL